MHDTVGDGEGLIQTYTSSFCTQRLIFSIKTAYQMLNTFKKYSAVEIKFIVQANMIALMISLTVYNDKRSYGSISITFFQLKR